MASTNNNNLLIVTYNMHGFYQGAVVVDDLVNSDVCPDVVLLQETWLTPANLYLLGEKFPTHFAIGKSAMSDRISQGPLIGRPYGGTSTLIKNELRSFVESVYCADRYVIVRINKLLIANIYLPCAGTADRLYIVDNVLQDVWSWRTKYPDCSFIIGGDFNCDFSRQNDVSVYIQNFLATYSLHRCDLKFPSRMQKTYVNESLGQSSTIDYFLCDVIDDIIDYTVVEPDINLSDHLPVTIRYNFISPASCCSTDDPHSSRVKRLRWDHADLLAYYSTTMNMLYPL
jgi:exonuclease III